MATATHNILQSDQISQDQIQILHYAKVFLETANCHKRATRKAI